MNQTVRWCCTFFFCEANCFVHSIDTCCTCKAGTYMTSSALMNADKVRIVGVRHHHQMQEPQHIIKELLYSITGTRYINVMPVHTTIGVGNFEDFLS